MQSVFVTVGFTRKPASIMQALAASGAQKVGRRTKGKLTGQNIRGCFHVCQGGKGSAGLGFRTALLSPATNAHFVSMLFVIFSAGARNHQPGFNYRLIIGVILRGGEWQAGTNRRGG